MKRYIIYSLIVGYLCFFEFGITDEVPSDATDLDEMFFNETDSERSSVAITEVELESPWNSTYDIRNETDAKVEYGIKSKVKGVFNKVKNKVKGIGNKVKNKFKEIGSKGNRDTGRNSRNGGYYYRYRKTTGSSFNGDTSTLLWVVFGIIGGSILITVLYYMIRAYTK